ncbi:MAG TPA: GNAT family N-acetyltransferase [Candidatus Lokiarchaeia archaeon]|nr:GNAT family N-acetyltransferase [Candidatus Lokiarchaeia archaeon]
MRANIVPFMLQSAEENMNNDASRDFTWQELVGGGLIWQIPLVFGGHAKPLVFSEGVNLGQHVVAHEIDATTETAAHEILSDIMAAHQAGDIHTTARYKCKNPLRWLSMIYPAVCNPRFVGLFFPGDTLLGWLSFSTSPSMPGKAIIGAVIRPKYRNAGLGTAAMLHAQKYLHDIVRDESITGIFFDTQERNARVMAIARRIKAVEAGRRVDELRGGEIMVSFTSEVALDA